MTRRALFALLAPSGVLAIGWWLYQMKPQTAGLWLAGIVLGVAMHRSRLCIAAAFRDSVLFHDTGPAKAILLALALSAVSFGWMQHQALQQGLRLPGNLYPITAGTVAGAFLFGMGMIPAGGCACSTLLRLGEGHLRFLWTLLGLTAGSLLGAYQYGWWEAVLGKTAPVHLPALLGWPLAAALEAVVFVGLFCLLRWWEQREEGL
ncbi:MAG TPA: YeeE/YedE thiosulfate transporter family protein [Symbiobacteriaceae bacterium]|jgi:hypothetical protein